MASENWQALADAVRKRRTALRLRQGDLEPRGGPSNGTVRNIEQAAREKYADRTFAQLEIALGWRDGLVEKILAGTATEDELAEVVARTGHASGTGTAYAGVTDHGNGLVTFHVPDRPTLAEASETELTLELLTRLMRRAGDVGRRADAVQALSALLPLLHDEQGADLT